MYLQCTLLLIEFTLIELDSGPGGDMCSKESQSGNRQLSYAIVAKKIVFCKFLQSIARALLGDLEERLAESLRISATLDLQ